MKRPLFNSSVILNYGIERTGDSSQCPPCSLPMPSMQIPASHGLIFFKNPSSNWGVLQLFHCISITCWRLIRYLFLHITLNHLREDPGSKCSPVPHLLGARSDRWGNVCIIQLNLFSLRVWLELPQQHKARIHTPPIESLTRVNINHLAPLHSLFNNVQKITIDTPYVANLISYQ